MKSYAFLLLLAACSPFAPDLDETPYLCGDTEPRCPDGYTCVENGQAATDKVCVANSGTNPDGGGNGFQCNNDGNLEGPNRNDDTAHAFVTPVDTPKVDFPLTMLAICPEGDRDTYAINLTMTNKGIKVTTTWASGDPVTAVIMNSGGATIAPSMPDGANGSKACAANLNTDTYYTQATAAAGVKNNYDLHITIVDNCL